MSTQDQTRRWNALQCAATAALLAVTLGLLLQFGLLGARVWADMLPPTAKAASDVTGGITWSTIVCSGVALGIAAGRHRERLMGLLGMVCAPTAFALAKGVQRGVETMLGGSAAPLGPLVYQIGLVKTVEYALLALILAALIARGWSTLWRHALVGLLFGAAGATSILMLETAHATGPLPAAKFMGIAVNELLFPVGCALVIYAVARLSGHVAPPAERDSDAAAAAGATS